MSAAQDALEPFEEQFNLPAIAIDQTDEFGGQILTAGHQHKRFSGAVILTTRSGGPLYLEPIFSSGPRPLRRHDPPGSVLVRALRESEPHCPEAGIRNPSFAAPVFPERRSHHQSGSATVTCSGWLCPWSVCCARRLLAGVIVQSSPPGPTPRNGAALTAIAILADVSPSHAIDRPALLDAVHVRVRDWIGLAHARVAELRSAPSLPVPIAEESQGFPDQRDVALRKRRPGQWAGKITRASFSKAGDWHGGGPAWI